MILLDIDILKKEIMMIEEDQHVQDAEQLKLLLGFLAGDKRTLRKMDLGDISDMFNNVDEILSYYREEELPFTSLGKMPVFISGKRRRAL